jgi:hypothetical protein
VPPTKKERKKERRKRKEKGGERGGEETDNLQNSPGLSLAVQQRDKANCGLLLLPMESAK